VEEEQEDEESKRKGFIALPGLRADNQVYDLTAITNPP